MKPFQVTYDGPHRIIQTATLPGHKPRELQVPEDPGEGTVVDLGSGEGTVVIPPKPKPSGDQPQAKPQS